MSIKKTSFNIPIYKIKLQKHNLIKSDLIKLLEASAQSSSSTEIEKLSAFDYCDSDDFDREWVKFICGYLQEELGNVFEDLQWSNARLMDIWFQKYELYDTHGWHTHAGHYSGIYYVNLNEKSPRTEFINLYTKDIVEFDCNEGDIILFPGLIPHRSKPNTDTEAKWIISFNFLEETG